MRHCAVVLAASLLLSPPAHAASFGINQPVEGAFEGTLEWGIGQINARPDEEHSLLFSETLNAESLRLTAALPGIDIGSAGAVELDATAVPSFSVVKDDPEVAFDILHVVSGHATVVELDIGGGEFRIDQDAVLGFRYQEDREIDDDIVGAGKLVKEGAGLLNLSGVNSYTGGSEVLEGDLRGDTDSLQGNFELATDTGLIFDFEQGGTQLYTARISGDGRLEKSGSGTLQIIGNASHTGGTQVRQGKLIASTGDLGGDVAVSSGATFQLHQVVTGDFTGAISGQGSLRKSGIGTLTLSGANSFTGGLTIAESDVVGSADSIPGDVDLEASDSRLIFQQTGVGTHSGQIGGPGSLVKSGDGTLTLAGTSSYSGGTTVQTGTLRGDAASLRGDITVNGGASLELSPASNQSFSGTIGGDGQLVKSGSGTLTIDSAQSFRGPTRIDGGTLRLNVDWNDSSSVVVGAGGRLQSGRAVGGDIEVSGRLAPTGLDTLGGAGDVTFDPGSWYELTVDDAGGSSALQVAGTTTVNGGTLWVEIEPGDYGAGGRTYTIVNPAAGGPTTGVDFEILQPPHPDAHAFARLTSDNIGRTNDITLSVQEVGNASVGYADTPNQRSTAVALDELLASGRGQPEIDSIRFSRVGLRVREVPDWLDGLAADTLGAFTNARLSNARQFAQALTRRFTATRFDAGQAPPRRRPGARADAGVGPGPLSSEPPREERGLGGWLEPFGIFGDLDGEGRASSIESRVYGVTTGGDYRFLFPESHSLRLGLGLGYTRLSLRSAGDRTTGWGNSYQTAAYAAFSTPLYHVGLAGRYAYSDMSSKRSIAFGDVDRIARGRFSGHEGSGLLETGLQLGDPRVALFHPTAGVLYTRLTQQGFSESGGGTLGLEVGAVKLDSLVTTLGARISRIMTLKGDYGIEPELRVAWNHEFADRGRHVSARFSSATGGGSFVNAGAERRRDDFQLGAGYVMRLGDVPLVTVNYDARLSEVETEHTLSLGLYLHW